MCFEQKYALVLVITIQANYYKTLKGCSKNPGIFFTTLFLGN